MSGEKDSYNLSDDLRVAGVSRHDAGCAHSPESGDSEGESDDKLAYGTETILIVDDLQMNIDVTRDMLEYLGYQVISALIGRFYICPSFFGGFIISDNRVVRATAEQQGSECN